MPTTEVPDTEPHEEIPDIRVVVVEDNSSFRRALSLTLSASDGIVCVADFSTAEQALKYLIDAACPDIILLDLDLPGINGLQAIPQFLELVEDAAILILTQADDRANVFDAISAGASGYLLKTSSSDEVVKGIVESANGGAALSSQIAKMVLAAFNPSAKKSDDDLSEREREVLDALSHGYVKKEIAGRLDISYHTVDVYVRRIYTKLHVHNVPAAVSKAIRRGLI